MFDGDILREFDWTRVKIIDQAWTKALEIADDDGSDIWKVAVDGVPAILKRTKKFHRNVRVQVFIDEIKPFFRLTKMGCTMIEPPGERPTLLMRFHGDGRNLAHLPLGRWVRDRAIAVELVKMAVLDLITVNNNRLTRNVLYVAPGEVVAIDEEKALDFGGLVTFRMSKDVRLAMIASGFDLPAFVELLRREDAPAQWRTVASRIFKPTHVDQILAGMQQRLDQLPADYWRYLDSRYGDGKKAGIKSKRQRAPNPWDVPDLGGIPKAAS
jgi:hypothetical protein